MKKIFSLVLMLLFVFTVGCGSAANTDAKTNKEEVKVTNKLQNKKVLVAYFSATGTTKKAAAALAKATNADLFEIVPEQPYTSEDLNYRNNSSRSCKEHADGSIRPAIKTKVADMKKYDVVFVGYPIWWGMAPNIMKTFVESYDFSGKTMVAFCTVYSSGFGFSDSELKALTPKAKWLQGEDLTNGNASAFVAKLKF